MKEEVKDLLKVIADLKDQIDTIEKYKHCSMDETSFNYQEGVLISGNTALHIVTILEKLANIQKDEKILDQTILLSFLHHWIDLQQWTDLEKKSTMRQFKRILSDFVVDYLLD